MADKEMMYNCRKAQLLESLMCAMEKTDCNHNSQICVSTGCTCA